MTLWDQITRVLAIEPFQHPKLETRSGSFSDFLDRYRPRNQEWRPPTISDALSVPAVTGIVSTIANTIGTLSLEAYRNGVKMAPEDRPRIVMRPDPDRRPGSFWRDSAWNLATRGEAWWWIGKRDIDGQPLSLVNVPPHEIMVESNPRDRRFPVIRWGSEVIPNEDIRQITYVREPGELRGRGPLQMCGAAVSVAVEAQVWAANFYAEGGKGGTILKSARELGVTPGSDWTPEAYQHEADILRAQWVARAHNTVRVIDPNIESVEEHQPVEAGAQMLQSRDFQIGELARMFMFPLSLIGYAVPGSSLTYQNVGQELDKFTRTCLIPHYLEKFEQEMSDLLTRSTTCEFNVDRLLRADIKTRYDVYGIAVDKNILTRDEIRQLEGLEPGDIERAPVPMAPPQALPGPIALREAEDVVRCAKCRKARFNIESTNPLRLRCVNCKDVTEAPVETRETPALQMHLHLPERMAVVENTMPEIRVESPHIEQPNVIVHTPDVHPPNVNITMPELPAPIVNIAAAEPADPPIVNITIPEQPAPVVNVSLPEPKPIRRTVERDADNKIIAIQEAS